MQFFLEIVKKMVVKMPNVFQNFKIACENLTIRHLQC